MSKFVMGELDIMRYPWAVIEKSKATHRLLQVHYFEEEDEAKRFAKDMNSASRERGDVQTYKVKPTSYAESKRR